MKMGRMLKRLVSLVLIFSLVGSIFSVIPSEKVEAALVSELPTLQENDARQFLGLIYNTKNWDKEEYGEIFFDLITGNYDRFKSVDEIILTKQAFSIFVRTSLNNQIQGSEYKLDILNKDLVDLLSKRLGKMKDMDEKIVGEYVSFLEEKIEDTILNLMCCGAAKSTGFVISDENIKNINIGISSYNQLINAPQKAVEYVENLVGALEAGMYVFNGDVYGRTTYLNLYIKNRTSYSSPNDPIFDYMMEYNAFVISDNTYFSNFIDFTTWITGKDSWNNHIDDLNRWGEFLYCLETADLSGEISDDLQDGDYSEINNMYHWKFNNHRYEIINESCTWIDAKNKCEEKGGHLVTITSKNEQEEVNSHVLGLADDRKNNYWIGLFFDDNKDDWFWITDEVVEYTNWALGEPNNFDNHIENYAHIIGRDYKGTKKVGEWNDAQTNGASYANSFFLQKNFGYICEWDSGSTDIEDAGTTNHTHFYGTWQMNNENHWKECTICAEKSSVSLHSDSDDNKKCDICSYIINSNAEDKDIDSSNLLDGDGKDKDKDTDTGSSNLPDGNGKDKDTHISNLSDGKDKDTSASDLLDDKDKKNTNKQPVNKTVKYKVKFNKNGGTGTVSTKTMTYGESVKLPANKFKKKGYKFVGWATSKANAKKLKVKYTDKQKVKNLSKKNGSTITLYAVWVKNTTKYKITYKLNGKGAKNVKANKTKYTVTTKTFKLQNPTRKGYKFTGWYTKKSGGKKVTKITKGSYGNKVLYAHWKKIR